MITLMEGKQVGTLYHYTSYNRLLGILIEDKLKNTNGYPSISFTRNKNYHRTDRSYDLIGKTICLVIDGDKLSEKYKIEPYNDWVVGYKEESEERIKEKEINHISQYIIKILVYQIPFNDYIEMLRKYTNLPIEVAK